MELPPTIAAPAVSEALQQLYCPLSSPRMRRRADSLLQSFQRSPEAADAALRMLQAPLPIDSGAAPGSPTSVVAQLKTERAFAASTLYFTVTSYVRKYKLDNTTQWTVDEKAIHESVSKQFSVLCQHVWDVLTGPNAEHEDGNVQTHLALTIAVILLRFHERSGDATFVTAVEWLVSNQKRPLSSGMACDVTNFAILLTLQVIPEEVDNKRVKFTKNKRTECEHGVKLSAPQVIERVLPTIASAIDGNENQHPLRGLLLKCISSWVEFGSVEPALLLESGLLARAFQETLRPVCSENAFLVIREVVRSCNKEAYVPLMVAVMKEFVQLGVHIRDSLASAAPAGTVANSSSTHPSSDLSFCLKSCATAISECGQSFISHFVDYTLDPASGSLVFEFLETILAFTSLPDIEVSNETMDFWIDFRAYISGKHEDRMYEFEKFIIRLLNILVERTQVPDNFEALSPMAKEQFNVYRNDVRSVFRALAAVSTASEDRFIVDAIHAIFHQYELIDAGQLSPMWWQKTEVYVHALSAVSKSIRQDDTSLIPRLFEYLSRDEPSHPVLARTTSIFLGVASHWFARNPSYIDTYAFKILSRSFDLGETRVSFPFRSRGHEDHVGAVALRKVALRCGMHMFNPMWIGSMLQLYRVNLSAPKVGTAHVDGSVSIVVESVANVVSGVSYTDATPVVDQLCTIMFEVLTTRFGDALTGSDPEAVVFLSGILDHLHVLATQIPPRINQDTPHPTLVALHKHWALLDGVLRLHEANEDVMEKFCGMLVGVFECIRAQALGLAAAIMPNLLEQFSRTQDGNILKVIKSVLLCTGNDEEATTSMTRVFVIVVESSLAAISAAGSIDDADPILLIALFDLVRACGTYQPLVLVESNQFEALLTLVLHALKVQTPEVGISTLSLLREIGAWYGEVQRTPREKLQSSELIGKVRLHHVIQTLFFDKDLQYHLLVALFQAAGGAMPSTLLENIAEVVRSCWSYFGRQRSEELMTRLLSDTGFLGAQVPQRTRGDFVATISRPECTDNSRKFRRVLSAFCDHCKKCLNENSPGVMS